MTFIVISLTVSVCWWHQALTWKLTVTVWDGDAAATWHDCFAELKDNDIGGIQFWLASRRAILNIAENFIKGAL